MKLNHFQCPTCGRLASVPWEAAWCMHQSQSNPSPPDHVDTDWTRMLPVISVQTADLPSEAEQWFVIEQRNRFGYPNDKIPGKDKRASKVIAGPLSREAAYSYIRTSTIRDNVPPHVHSFRAIPGDLVYLVNEDDED